MADDQLAMPAPPPRPRLEPIDRYLNVATAVLLAAVLGFGGFFGYEVYRTRQAANAADPSFKVLRDLRAQVEKNPNDAEAHGLYAEALASAGHFSDARRELATAVKLQPKYPGAYMALAKIAFLEKKNDEAEKALKKVIELTADAQFENINNRREEAYFYLGELALADRRYEEAVGALKAAIRINRTASDSYVRLAQAYLGLEEKEAAIDNLKIALAFDPKFPEANYEIGRLLLEKGDKMRAAEHFRAAIEGEPEAELPAQALASLGEASTYRTQASAALTKGDAKAALVSIRTARAIEPRDFEACMLEGRVLERLKRYKDAADVYRFASNLQPENAEARAAMARAEAASKKQTAEKGGGK